VLTSLGTQYHLRYDLILVLPDCCHLQQTRLPSPNRGRDREWEDTSGWLDRVRCSIQVGQALIVCLMKSVRVKRIKDTLIMAIIIVIIISGNGFIKLTLRLFFVESAITTTRLRRVYTRQATEQV
jgi:hypothetical protein